MKASIYMATWNKNECLSNTLYSIARQKVSFPYEVCIVDDHSDVDPEPIIREFIPDAKYLRLEKQVGFDVVTTYALSLASSDADIIIMQSADVIHTQKNTIEELCKHVSSKEFVVAAVRNADVDEDMYKTFDESISKLLTNWGKGQVRCGSGHLSWYFFLGAIRRDDLETLNVREPWCDVMLRSRLQKQGFKSNLLVHLKGIHQTHPATWVPCTNMETCTMPTCKLRKYFLGR